MLPNVIESLRSADPKERVNTLHVLGQSPDIRPETLTELERLLEDRTCAMLDLPHRYGEIRTLAAQVLAVARAKLGDLRLIHLMGVPRGLTSDRMGPIADKAGIPLIGGPKGVELYRVLRDGGHVPTSDYIFDPREHLDDEQLAQLSGSPRTLRVTFNAAGAPDAPFQERIELREDGAMTYVRWRGSNRIERTLRATEFPTRLMFRALDISGFPEVPVHEIPPGASLMEIQLDDASGTRSVFMHLYTGMSFLGYGDILHRMNEWVRCLRDPQAPPHADFAPEDETAAAPPEAKG